MRRKRGDGSLLPGASWKASGYGIEKTPTLLHFDDGTEISRLEGQQSERDYRSFFEDYVLD